MCCPWKFTTFLACAYIWTPSGERTPHTRESARNLTHQSTSLDFASRATNPYQQTTWLYVYTVLRLCRAFSTVCTSARLDTVISSSPRWCGTGVPGAPATNLAHQFHPCAHQTPQGDHHAANRSPHQQLRRNGCLEGSSRAPKNCATHTTSTRLYSCSSAPSACSPASSPSSPRPRRDE